MTKKKKKTTNLMIQIVAMYDMCAHARIVYIEYHSIEDTPSHFINNFDEISETTK